MSVVNAASNRNGGQQRSASESSDKVDDATTKIKDKLSQSWKDWDVSNSDLKQINSMALDYRLDLQADIKPAALITKITKSIGIPMVKDNVLQDSQSHFTVSAYKVTDKWIVEECENEHGFKPSTYISMRHGKVMGETNEALMMSTVIELLREYEGNAVLEFSESPSIVLKRIDGAITLNSEWQEIAGLDKLDSTGWSYDVAALDEE